MLFLLTGDVQIGKTTWLQGLIADLENEGACAAGVVAPGQWVPRAENEPGRKHGLDGAGRFEKLGIDNVLLPQGTRIEFARRRDLAEAGQTFAEGSQAKAAQLAWAISDEAIAQVNRHFDRLATFASECNAKPDDSREAKHASQASPAASPNAQLKPGALLVVDELGRLELLRGCGLTSAMALLAEGPSKAFPHALVVVRDTLVSEARRQFEPVWGEAQAIGPTNEARQLVMETVARQS